MYPADNEAAASSAAAVLAETAFRRAEKRYQLHYEQHLRHRKGRVKGGKLVAQPTDFSGVIDVRSPQDTPDVTAVTCSSNNNNNSSSSSSTPGNTSALVFQKHPGLVVFPAAVSADLQLQLLRAALEEWPEPPARTNHTRVHGSRLCGLFQAAQQGLSLAMSPTLGPEQQQPDNHHQQEQQQQQDVQDQQQCLTQCHQHCHACSHQQEHQQEHHYHHHHHHHHHQQQQQCSLPANDIISSSSSCWSATGEGPKAALLLRKLRWVCLGPPYNWTDRVYEPHLPHRPLPPELIRIACQFAALSTQAVQAAARHKHEQLSLQAAAPAGVGQAPSAGPAGVPRRPAEPHAVPPHAGSSSCATGQHKQQECTAEYVPDAALVNYYHAGDTLNGHQDDVERDLTQPIVTLSLGCDAVFLVGGRSRDVEPTALLLRSGDVVVMAEEARACYHGTPRVLTDRPLPQELMQAAEQHDGQVFTPYIHHMQGCRINISMRAT